jgi:MtN3 and saliva related transmembrane protein
MENANMVGFIAGTLTTLAFIPQVARIWKTRSARDVSLPAFITFTAGVALWLAYGILLQDLAITLWNSVTLLLAIAILWMKIRFG